MLKQLLYCLDSRGKHQYVVLAICSVASSLLQTLGVAAISLFFAVLLGGKLPTFAQNLVESYDFAFLGLLVLVATVSGTVSSGLVTYLGIKISWEQYEKIADRLLKQYLDNPYDWHLQRHSSELINAVLGEARAVCGLLQQCVLLLVKGTEVLFLVVLLFVAKPYVATVTLVSFSGVYFVLYRLNRGIVREQGRLLVKANADRQKAVTEALSGIKAVKVAGNAEYFRDRFLEAAERTTGATIKVQYFSMMPKYFIEVLLFGGLVSFVVIAQTRHWGVFESIPLLALYGAAALRMLPAAQQLYYSALGMVAGQAVVQKIFKGLIGAAAPASESDDKRRVGATSDSLVLLQNVSYRYPQAKQGSLNDVSLDIKKGEKIGIVGATGAGKTTLVDLLLGLLSPTTGTISVAEKAAGHEHLVAYVPQQIHFLDDTLAANIAWGIPEEQRDLTLVESAARKARIHDHIVTLPEGYQSMMGERGVRLSGGQCQRIGIARGLYLEPALLVLDEASNALDAETEGQVLDALFEQDLTMVVIAHRLSTLRGCTRLLVMREGQIVDQGTFDGLLESCPYFRNLAEADAGRKNRNGSCEFQSLGVK